MTVCKKLKKTPNTKLIIIQTKTAEEKKMLTLSTGAKNVKSMQFCKMKKSSVCLKILYLAIVLGRKAVEKVRQVPLSHTTHVSRDLNRMLSGVKYWWVEEGEKICI